MKEIPAGVWRWLDRNAKDIGRVASALETIARELAAIRREMEKDDRQEDGS